MPVGVLVMLTQEVWFFGCFGFCFVFIWHMCGACVFNACFCMCFDTCVVLHVHLYVHACGDLD